MFKIIKSNGKTYEQVPAHADFKASMPKNLL